MNLAEGAKEAYKTEIMRLLQELQQCDLDLEVAATRRKFVKVQIEAMQVAFGGPAPTNSNGEIQKVTSEMSVRDAIVAVLRESGRGMRPKEIVDRLLMLAYQFPGRTDHSARTSNELARLLKRGIIAREDGKYSYIEV